VPRRQDKRHAPLGARMPGVTNNFAQRADAGDMRSDEVRKCGRMRCWQEVGDPLQWSSTSREECVQRAVPQCEAWLMPVSSADHERGHRHRTVVGKRRPKCRAGRPVKDVARGRRDDVIACFWGNASNVPPPA